MSDAPAENLMPATPACATPPSGAAPRQSRLITSVAGNWVWFGVVIASGFVLPRLIDEYQGSDVLGIWDFGWSMVVSVRWLHLGMAGALNRYVARYVTTAEWRSLNVFVNSALGVLALTCMAGLLIAGGVGLMAPRLLQGIQPEHAAVVRWTAFLLSTVALSEMAGNVINSLITGSGRFDVLNVLRTVREMVTLGLMVVVLGLGRGLIALAVTMLLTSIVLNAIYLVAARRLIPMMRLAPGYFQWREVRTILGFSSKSVAHALSRGMLYQVNSILVGMLLGPLALALYSRQRSLVQNGASLVSQYACVLLPKSSALDARGDIAGLQSLLIKGSTYGWYLALPIMLTIVLIGTPVVRLWMGADYMAPAVLATLASGHLLPIAQNSVYMILIGQGRHGVPALYSVGAAVLSVALAYTSMKFGAGLAGAAAAIAISLTLSEGVLGPMYACRLLKLSYWTYLKDTVLNPLLISAPYALCLLAARLMFPDSDYLCVLVGLASGAAVLGLEYWLWVLPASLKASLVRGLQMGSVESH